MYPITPLTPQSLLSLMFQHHQLSNNPYSQPQATFGKNLAYFDLKHYNTWWRGDKVEIIRLNNIIEKYQTIFLIHKIQDVVLDDVSLSFVVKIIVIVVIDLPHNVIF